jgi:hypothetical protein
MSPFDPLFLPTRARDLDFLRLRHAEVALWNVDDGGDEASELG